MRITLNVSDIDYEMLLARLAENKQTAGTAAKLIPTGLIKLMPKSQKDKAVVGLINSHKDQVLSALQKVIDDNGVGVTLSDISAEQ